MTARNDRDPMTCDDYQIAFEQQMRAAPAPVTEAELACHLEGCAACAAYVVASRKVSDSMESALTLSPAPPPLEAVTAHIGRERRRTIGGIVIAPLIFAAGLLMARLADSGPTAGLFVGTAVSAALFGGFVAYRSRRRLAQLAALEGSSGGELVSGLRGDLAREIRQLRSARVVFPICLAALFVDDAISARVPDAFELVVAAAMLAMVPFLVVRHRRLVREHGLLGE